MDTQTLAGLAKRLRERGLPSEKDRKGYWLVPLTDQEIRAIQQISEEDGSNHT